MPRPAFPRRMPDHHSAPYSLTEDFVTVYRLHPLLPDDYCLLPLTAPARRSPRRASWTSRARDADDAMRAFGLRNTLYSFGIAHPGAITLHNFPRSLTSFERNSEIIDLSVVDIVRTRRRGVPRYNDFRAGLHRPRDHALGRADAESRRRAPAQGDLWRHRQGRHGGRADRRSRRRQASASATRPSASSS